MRGIGARSRPLAAAHHEYDEHHWPPPALADWPRLTASCKPRLTASRLLFASGITLRVSHLVSGVLAPKPNRHPHPPLVVGVGLFRLFHVRPLEHGSDCHVVAPSQRPAKLRQEEHCGAPLPLASGLRTRVSPLVSGVLAPKPNQHAHLPPLCAVPSSVGARFGGMGWLQVHEARRAPASSYKCTIA